MYKRITGKCLVIFWKTFIDIWQKIIAMANIVGTTLLNQDRVDAFIASGGMGAVYRVWDLKQNVFFAMKVRHSEFADDPHVFKRFKCKANALKKLTPPNIVQFYGLFQILDLNFRCVINLYGIVRIGIEEKL